MKRKYSAMNNTKTLNETFEILFNTKKDADITFIVHGKELLAHKLILSSRSSVFNAMINSNLKTEDGKHLINDPEITFEDFENFLKFLYTDQCSVTDDNVEKLMHLGNFYNVDCVQCIKPTISIGHNVLKYAELGLLYSETSSLLDVCLTEIPKCLTSYNSLSYTIKNKHKNISPELALKIVEKCERNKTFTEEGLFRQIVDWAEHMDGNKAGNRENLRAALKPLMPHFKLEMLNALTLAKIVRENNLVDDTALANALSKAVIASENRRLRKLSPVYEGVSPSYPHESPRYGPCSP